MVHAMRSVYCLWLLAHDKEGPISQEILCVSEQLSCHWIALDVYSNNMQWNFLPDYSKINYYGLLLNNETCASRSIFSCYVTYVYTFVPMFPPVYSCVPMFTLVYLCLPSFTRLYLCSPCFTCDSLPMFTHVHSCLPMFTLVYLYLPLLTWVYLSLFMCPYIYQCLLVFTYIHCFPYVYSCLPMFTLLYLCLP